MSSWGSSTADESKPKYLTDAEKRDCYADNTGWTVEAGGNDGITHGVPATGNKIPDRETLVAIGDLSGATKLAEASISSARLITTAFGAAVGGEFSAEVVYNERVTVVGTPQLTITSTGANLTLDYVSGSLSNRLTYTATIAGDATTEADVLTLGANAVSLNGGEINDTGSGNAAPLTHGVGTGTVTVVA